MSAGGTPVDIGLSLGDVSETVASVAAPWVARATAAVDLGTTSWLLVALPALCAGLVVLNLLTWSRPRAAGKRSAAALPHLSVLIPARNEADNIGACLEAVVSAGRPLEVLVYDDRSTDNTAAIVRAFAREHDNVHLIDGAALPAGWNGKSHGCHRLAEAAHGEVLLFVDADVRLAPGALAAVGDSFRRDKTLGVLTALPRQVVGTWMEQLVVPLLHVTYLSWLWLPLIRWVGDPRVLAANGQLLAVRRRAYAAVGGFASVRHAVVDDMAFCKRAKTVGVPVAFVDGSELASCRMYDSAQGVWEGFSKNLYAGLGAQPLVVAAVASLYAATFIVPFLALGASVWLPSLALPATVALVLLLSARALVAWRFAHPAWTVPMVPVAVALLLAIAFNSWLWFKRGDVRWRGRRYQPGLQGIAVGSPSSGRRS